jgi:hypothetical protein
MRGRPSADRISSRSNSPACAPNCLIAESVYHRRKLDVTGGKRQVSDPPEDGFPALGHKTAEMRGSSRPNRADLIIRRVRSVPDIRPGA